MNSATDSHNRVLVLYAHPSPHKSRANRVLVEAAEKTAGVTVRHLYELYPDFIIDVKEEQRLMEMHEVIVIQHPFYWYSAPALIKEWMDLVLEEGWAYGKAATALKGKCWQQVITCGGSEVHYRADGRHSHSIPEYLLPFGKSAELCGMTFLPPFAVYDADDLDGAALAAEAQRYRALLTKLVEGGQHE